MKLIDFGRSALGGDPEDPDLYDIYTDEEYRRINDDYTRLWKFEDIFKNLLVLSPLTNERIAEYINSGNARTRMQVSSTTYVR